MSIFRSLSLDRSLSPGWQMMTSVKCLPPWIGMNKKSLEKMSTRCQEGDSGIHVDHGSLWPK